jgi:hypothetical protein
MLFTLAEIAVALAGFSAIIGVLSSRRESADLKINALRLQVMLETCFMVAAAALAPIIVNYFVNDSPMLWRISAALFLCVAIPFEFIAARRTRDMPKMTLAKLNVNSINWALSIGADIVLAAIVVGFVGSNEQAFYVLALFSQLTLAGSLFVQFAADTFTHADKREDE